MRDIQSATVTLAGANVVPESADVKLDRLWAPYVQGRIVVAGLLDLDPDNLGRAIITYEQTFATGHTADEIAAQLPGQSAAAIAAEWSPASAQQAAQAYMVNLNGVYIPPARAVLNLTIKEVEQDLGERRTTLTVTSDEQILIDGALVESSAVSYASLSVRSVVSQVLTQFGFSLAADAGADGTLTEAAVWTPGQRAWDFLAPLLEQSGLRLYCDERRIWHLVDMEHHLPGSVTLSTTTTVSAASPTIDNESAGYDSVVCIYRFTTTAGTQLVRYDVAGANPGRKTHVVTYDNTIYPGPGAAARLLARLTKRRIRIPLEAAAHYGLRPTMGLTLNTPAGNSGGRVASVSFRYPDRDMSVEGYDFEAIDPISVRAIPDQYETDQLPGTTASLNPGRL